MMNSVNQSIKCTVSQCRHHAQGQNYCTLNDIMVGTHETDPKQKQCTDCESFERK